MDSLELASLLILVAGSAYCGWQLRKYHERNRMSDVYLRERQTLDLVTKEQEV